MTTTTTLDIRPIAGLIGAEVFGLDLRSLDDDTFAAVHQAFLDHHVLVFRGQDLSPADQIAFGHRFGDLDEHPYVEMNADHPEILDVVTRADDKINFGGGWHTDVTFLDQPDLGSILYAVELPPVGGDTLFANQHAAYDALSDTMKGMLDGLVAIHSAERQYGARGQSTVNKDMKTKNAEEASTRVEHPVVRTHPETGRKGLYVNQAFTTRIVGMTQPESNALLRFLWDHAVHERFTCRVRWEPGTLTMWDNRSVQHHALFDFAGHTRRMRRITVKGDRPV